MDDLVVLYTTWPDADTAEAAGRAAVETKLAACANVLGPMRAIYRWDGALHNDSETPMLLKTTAPLAKDLTAFIVNMHPYDTPCVLALEITESLSHSPYLDWARTQVAR